MTTLRALLATVACFGVALAAPSAMGAAIPINGVFIGTTSQVLEGNRAPVKLQVGSRGRKLFRAEFAWFMNCPDAPGEYASIPLAQASLTRNAAIHRGRFGGTVEYESTGGNLKPGYTAKIRLTVHGSFVTYMLAKGTLFATAEVTDPQGQHFASCRMPGPARWSAIHR